MRVTLIRKQKLSLWEIHLNVFIPLFDDQYGWNVKSAIKKESLTGLQFLIKKPKIFSYDLFKNQLIERLINILKKLKERRSSFYPLLGYQKGDALADCDTGYLYVRAETYENFIGNKKIYSAAAIFGCSPEKKYFKVPNNGHYKITFNVEMTSGQVDNLVQIFYNCIGKGFAYGEAILEGRIHKWDDDTNYIGANKHTFYYKYFTVDGDEYTYNFINDPKEINVVIDDVYLYGNIDYYFICVLAMSHEISVSYGEAKADGQLKMYIKSVCVYSIS